MDIEDIKNFAWEHSSSSRGSHDWGHTLRVYNLCVRIGKTENADMAVLASAAYLHDIGRTYEDMSRGKICHAEKGAEIALEFLQNSSFSSEQKANIIHSIRCHRFRGRNRPESLEAKILFDADKLDSIGAVGVGRAFQFAGEVGAVLHNPDIDPKESEAYSINDTAYREFMVKLSGIKDRIMTLEGRRIAEERSRFMELFFERFLMECENRA